MELSESKLDGIALIGFRLQADSVNPDFFTLMAYGERDFPVRDGVQIVFFTEPALAAKVCEYWPEEIRRLAKASLEIDLVCDVAKALHIIKNEDQDDSSILLNCLNTFFDLVVATGHACPKGYERALSRLADRLTFEREFATFLEQEHVSRSDILDAFLWCMGSIAANAKLITNNEAISDAVRML